jgi:hypothetical protein
MVIVRGGFLSVNGLLEDGGTLSPNVLRGMLLCGTPDGQLLSCVTNGNSRLRVKQVHYHVRLFTICMKLGL